MIIGENSRPNDMDVNVTKEKKQTNMRARLKQPLRSRIDALSIPPGTGNGGSGTAQELLAESLFSPLAAA